MNQKVYNFRKRPSKVLPFSKKKTQTSINKTTMNRKLVVKKIQSSSQKKVPSLQPIFDGKDSGDEQPCLVVTPTDDDDDNDVSKDIYEQEPNEQPLMELSEPEITMLQKLPLTSDYKSQSNTPVASPDVYSSVHAQDSSEESIDEIIISSDDDDDHDNDDDNTSALTSSYLQQQHEAIDDNESNDSSESSSEAVTPSEMKEENLHSFNHLRVVLRDKDELKLSTLRDYNMLMVPLQCPCCNAPVVVTLESVQEQ
jgi:hypothetical protein